MDDPFQHPHQANLGSDQRVCHICRTKKTSQWRYRHPDNKILCNACGIRWKRKNKQTNQDRIKPGRKTGSKLVSSSSKGESSKSPQPPSSAGPSKPYSSTVSTMMNVRAIVDNKATASENKQGKSRQDEGQSHHRSKMAISNLMSPVDVEPKSRSKKH